MGGPEGGTPRRPAGGVLRRLPGEGRRPSPETRQTPRGKGRPADRTGAGRSGGGPLADGTTAQGTTTAARHQARRSGGPPRTGGGPGLSRSGAVRDHPQASTRALPVPDAAQDFPLKDLVRRFASHAAGGLESLVLLGPYPAGYCPHMAGVPPGLSFPPGAGPLARKDAYASVWQPFAVILVCGLCHGLQSPLSRTVDNPILSEILCSRNGFLLEWNRKGGSVSPGSDSYWYHSYLSCGL